LLSSASNAVGFTISRAFINRFHSFFCHRGQWHLLGGECGWCLHRLSRLPVASNLGSRPCTLPTGPRSTQSSRRRATALTQCLCSVFCGQLTGTAIGNRLFAKAGRLQFGSASVSVFEAFLVIRFVQAPHGTIWIGWHASLTCISLPLNPDSRSGIQYLHSTYVLRDICNRNDLKECTRLDPSQSLLLNCQN
jgi:hypothetical protein